MNKGQGQSAQEIANIKQRLLELGHMHPGSLSQQKRSGKGHTKYVRPEDVPEVRREMEWATLRHDERKSTRRDTGKE